MKDMDVSMRVNTDTRDLAQVQIFHGPSLDAGAVLTKVKMMRFLEELCLYD